MSARLFADRGQMEHFVTALFRDADPYSWVSLRSFWNDANGVALPSQSIRVEPRARFVDFAVAYAQRCANHRRPIVFAPPLATFRSPVKATTENLADVLVLSVECDTQPELAIESLTAILGRPTVLVMSGGRLLDPDTGEVQNKVHAHWRLVQAATTPDEHDKAYRARRLMCRIVGSDSTAVPLVHPFRWPGSWHRKAEPRKARIVEMNDTDVDLAHALAGLEEFVRSCGVDIDEPSAPYEGNPEKVGKLEDVEMYMRGIPNPHPNEDKRDPGASWRWWNYIGMALWNATAGSGDGLRLFHQWSSLCTSKYNEVNTDARWRHYAKHPPSDRPTVSGHLGHALGAGTLAYQFSLFWIDPVDDWTEVDLEAHYHE